MYDELEDLLRGDDGTTDRFFHRVAELHADIDDAAAVVGVERKECDDAGDGMEVSVMRAMLSVRRVRACVPLRNIVGITVPLFTCPPDRCVRVCRYLTLSVSLCLSSHVHLIDACVCAAT
jgi:hypothetical protein